MKLRDKGMERYRRSLRRGSVNDLIDILCINVRVLKQYLVKNEHIHHMFLTLYNAL